MAHGSAQGLSTADIRRRAGELGEWFHNLDLRGVETAPGHFLGDFPRQMWRAFAHLIPQDLTGKTVLDIGCNGGFYSIEMKRRGASRVVGIDYDSGYLAQARFAAQVLGQDIEFRQLSVYDVAELGEKFDIVLFMGVLYHLRHPLLALDLVHEHVAKDVLVFQSMLRGSAETQTEAEDHAFDRTDIFARESFPRMYFIEQRYAGDETNWWIPNRSCMEAMLRSSGFDILQHVPSEVFLCRRREMPDDPRRGLLRHRRVD